MSQITLSDVILLAHATFGVLGTLAALWVFVEALNSQRENAGRAYRVALATAGFMICAWILGGYWYLHFYPADRAMILKGPWPFAHTLFMETKEHLFLATLILSFYLPIVAKDFQFNAGARRMVLAVAVLIALSGLAVEGAGGVINHGAKVALLHSLAKGAY